MSQDDAPDTSPSKYSSRRCLLSALLVGGVGATSLPARWTRPVVDSVLLPAHAQTTQNPDADPDPDPDPDSCSDAMFVPQEFTSADGLQVQVPECATMVTLTLVGGAGGSGGGSGGGGVGGGVGRLDLFGDGVDGGIGGTGNGISGGTSGSGNGGDGGSGDTTTSGGGSGGPPGTNDSPPAGSGQPGADGSIILQFGIA